MNATTSQLPDISYCCSNLETCDATTAIKKWIEDRETKGWTVSFQVKQDASGAVGVMWQCISHKDGHYQEFTDCISMTGREFRMN